MRYRDGKRLHSFSSRPLNGSKERCVVPFSYRREVRKFSFGLRVTVNGSLCL
jgi:hypothetical protein